MAGFAKSNAREIRESEIFACARELRGKYKKLGCVGYCFGGWGVLVRRSTIPRWVDCVVCAQPAWVTEEDFTGYGSVPLVLLAPQVDAMFTEELKGFSFRTLVLERKGDEALPVEYVHFPGVAHGCLTKGDENVKGEREAMAKGKNNAVTWFRQWLAEE